MSSLVHKQDVLQERSKFSWRRNHFYSEMSHRNLYQLENQNKQVEPCYQRRAAINQEDDAWSNKTHTSERPSGFRASPTFEYQKRYLTAYVAEI